MKFHSFNRWALGLLIGLYVLIIPARIVRANADGDAMCADNCADITDPIEYDDCLANCESDGTGGGGGGGTTCSGECSNPDNGCADDNSLCYVAGQVCINGACVTASQVSCDNPSYCPANPCASCASTSKCALAQGCAAKSCTDSTNCPLDPCNACAAGTACNSANACSSNAHYSCSGANNSCVQDANGSFNSPDCGGLCCDTSRCANTCMKTRCDVGNCPAPVYGDVPPDPSCADTTCVGTQCFDTCGLGYWGTKYCPPNPTPPPPMDGNYNLQPGQCTTSTSNGIPNWGNNPTICCPAINQLSGSGVLTVKICSISVQNGNIGPLNVFTLQAVVGVASLQLSGKILSAASKFEYNSLAANGVDRFTRAMAQNSTLDSYAKLLGQTNTRVGQLIDTNISAVQTFFGNIITLMDSPKTGYLFKDALEEALQNLPPK